MVVDVFHGGSTAGVCLLPHGKWMKKIDRRLNAMKLQLRVRLVCDVFGWIEWKMGD